MITVTMEGTAIIIRPTGRLDAETIDTVTQLLASADAAGTVAQLDIRGVDRRDRPAAEALLAAADRITQASVA